MNHVTEYRKRHNLASIPVAHDGVLFYDYLNQPSLVVLTSLACKSHMSCNNCDGNSICVEYFCSGEKGILVPHGHFHVDYNCDLRDFVNRTYFNFTPYHAPTIRHLEAWLWKFCTKSPKFRIKSVEDDPLLKTLEQMTYCVQKHSKLYQAYYHLYELFLAQRKYLLLGGE